MKFMIADWLGWFRRVSKKKWFKRFASILCIGKRFESCEIACGVGASYIFLSLFFPIFLFCSCSPTKHCSFAVKCGICTAYSVISIEAGVISFKYSHLLRQKPETPFAVIANKMLSNRRYAILHLDAYRSGHNNSCEQASKRMNKWTIEWAATRDDVTQKPSTHIENVVVVVLPIANTSHNSWSVDSSAIFIFSPFVSLSLASHFPSIRVCTYLLFRCMCRHNNTMYKNALEIGWARTAWKKWAEK